jgi:hypothetical protein
MKTWHKPVVWLTGLPVNLYVEVPELNATLIEYMFSRPDFAGGHSLTRGPDTFHTKYSSIRREEKDLCQENALVELTSNVN